MIERTFSHYKILSQIGAGGMGVVYLAEDARLHRKVALKFLPPSVAHDASAKARFLFEAEAASALDHPNIATVYEIGESDGELFIAMAYYEGETLKQRIERGPLAVGDVAAIVEQVASGLAAAHAAGMVHRDVKPANIIVRPDGQVKILDFGLAKVLAIEETRLRMTSPGSTVGTVAYMSPEQLRGEDVDQAADMWALGILLYELLTGRLPFDGPHPAALMSSILSDTPLSIKSLPPEVPPELAQVVSGALVKDRHARRLTAVDAGRLVTSYRVRSSSATMPALPVTLSNTVPWKRVLVPTVLVLLVAVAGGGWAVNRNSKIRWANEQAVPEISRLIELEQYVAAFTLAGQAERYVPTNRMLAKLWPVMSRTVSVDTVPDGAEVSYRNYSEKDGGWTHLGRTPLHGVRVPRGMFRWRIEKDGSATTEDAAGSGPATAYTLSYRLDATNAAPAGMVRVSSAGSPFAIYIPGLDHLPEVRLADFWIDRYEVTNRAFKRFVDDGGYQRREFWKQPFDGPGGMVPWEQAIARFHDTTGRSGPSAWELGAYARGQDEDPVTGISWFEAAAYAEYAGKALPTIYHWSRAASQQSSASFVPASNFGGRGVLPVGASGGMNRFGAYDMAGNVKEWCWNAAGPGKRYILGGAWNDPVYMFTDADARSPFNREMTFGFRCIKPINGEVPPVAVSASVEFPSRDFANEQPVGDEAFNAYRSLYSYDKTDLRARIEAIDDTDEGWRREKTSFDAAYGNERVVTYLFLPRGKPPYQTVVFFPGSNGLKQRSFEAALTTHYFDYIMKSGRALAFPVYKSTFERGDGLESDYPNTTSFWRDHVIMWSKDLGRTVDYLASRGDIAADKIGYLGVSWGGDLGAILPAIETRIKVVVLQMGGFPLQKALPEADAINFAPRVKVPTLMLNGKYDFFSPTEASQLPLFRFLGSRPDEKRRVEYETGHSIPRGEQVRETLDWLDKYLGPVAVK